ncbi:MAG: hypothetical protein LBC82_09935 [Oscillospiraceae bacterium]|jgi:hypothetical protein|nr:hypothetical protein [Oscillospiraceae bacterium]
MGELFKKIILLKVVFLLGVIIGFYLSPIKKGIKIINYNQCDGKLIKETEIDDEQD